MRFDLNSSIFFLIRISSLSLHLVYFYFPSVSPFHSTSLFILPIPHLSPRFGPQVPKCFGSRFRTTMRWGDVAIQTLPTSPPIWDYILDDPDNGTSASALDYTLPAHSMLSFRRIMLCACQWRDCYVTPVTYWSAHLSLCLCISVPVSLSVSLPVACLFRLLTD